MSKKVDIIMSRLIRYFKTLDRIGKTWYGFIAIGAILLSSVFGFTVVNHAYYKEKADYQQKTIVSNPVSRGTINSSANGIQGVVAVSTNLGTLAIDPSQSGSKDDLSNFLSDAVYMEFCTHTSQEDCLESIGSYVRNNLTTLEDKSEKNIKEQIKKYLITRMDAPVESVLVAPDLDDKKIELVSNLNDESLFFVINNLYVNPTLVKSPEILAGKLAEILGMKAEEILPKFAIRAKQHLEILRKMSIGTRDFINEYLDKNTTLVQESIVAANEKAGSTEEKNAIKKDLTEKLAVYPFIKIEDNLVRYYPEWDSMGQITGFVDNEWIGRYGIEGYFEKELQGESPRQVITKDSQWRLIRDYMSGSSLTLQNGVNISLTIDRNIQKEVSNRLEKYVKQLRANAGSVIIMDPKTGAIIAMANYPSYDPNNFTNVYEMEPVLYETYPNPKVDLFGYPLFVIDTMSGTVSTNIDGKRLKLRPAQEDEIDNFAIQKFKYKNGYGAGNYKNDVISALFEPGSIFKPVTVASALDAGEIRPEDTYFDKNEVVLKDPVSWIVTTRIKNYSTVKCGWYHTYQSALNWSCNVGMIDIIQKLGQSLFYKYIVDFWFWAKTNMSIDGEVFSQLGNYNNWPKSRFFNMSFWQWISVTLLQMAAAYSVLANGWVYMQPYLVESLTYPDWKKIESVPTPVRRVIKEETSRTITAMMVDGAKRWYALAGAVPGYTMAWKTGTAQIAYKGTYENLAFNSAIAHTMTSYGWFAPAYNPKFVMIIRIDRPRTSSDSELTAAKVYADIAEYLLNYYKIPKNE